MKTQLYPSEAAEHSTTTFQKISVLNPDHTTFTALQSVISSSKHAAQPHSTG